jgi:hypothetical protein
VEQLGRLGQAAGAGISAGQPASRRLEHQRAALAQGAHIGPGGGMLPHLGVHRRREHHWALGRQQDRGQQVVCPPGGRPGQQVGGGGCDNDQIRFLAQPDVRHLVHVVEGAGADRLAGQRRPGGRADEPQ